MAGIIRVFLSCPSDLNEEKKIVAKEVDKLNQVLEKLHGVSVRLLTWESDTYSSAGTDGQDVINRQIGDDCEVYLGMIGAKLGTSTLRAESGTAEEYDRALASFQAKGIPIILFFLIDKELRSSAVNIEELARVNAFIKKVQKNVLTKTARVEELDIAIHLNLFKAIFASGLIPRDTGVKVKDEEVVQESYDQVMIENPIIIDQENKFAEIKKLTKAANDSQAWMLKNMLQQGEVMSSLDGPHSWCSKWLTFNGGEARMKQRTPSEILESSNELRAIAEKTSQLLREFKKRYRSYIEASILLFSHPTMKQGFIGVEEVIKWIDNGVHLLSNGVQGIANNANNFERLHNLSNDFAKSKAMLVHALREMAHDYWFARDLLITLRETVRSIPTDSKGNNVPSEH